MDLIIYTDGGARGNPGPAGIGAVLWEDQGNGNTKEVLSIKEYIGENTNNFAEYTALITALNKALELGATNVQCLLDSELVVRQLNGSYKVKEPTLKPLFEQVHNLKSKFQKITFEHIRREKNQLADKLVNEAIDEHLANH